MQRITPLHPDRRQETVADLIDPWSTHLHNHDHAAGTVKKYTQAVAGLLSWYEEQNQTPLTLDAFTPIVLIGYRNELQHEQQKSISTINLRISALRAWCSWLQEQGYLAVDPAARVKLLSGTSGSSREGLTQTQVNALLHMAEQSPDPLRNYAIVQVLVQTGLRLNECARLTFGDIMIGERSGTVLVRAGKGNKVRSVPLNSSAREALVNYVALRLQIEKLSVKAVAAAWPGKTSSLIGQSLWKTTRGTLTSSGMGQMIADLVQASRGKVPEETSAHTLRHTFARQYLGQYPGDLVGLATLLGHSSLDTTRLYSQPSTQELGARVEKLNINAYGE
jgi:site-specific recombinase XerD